MGAKLFRRVIVVAVSCILDTSSFSNTAGFWTVKQIMGIILQTEIMLAGVGLVKPCYYQEWRLWLQDSFLGSVRPRGNEELAEDSISVA